jgi:diadenosine tetraphosphate (Ap4A) HIT family hydrolase
MQEPVDLGPTGGVVWSDAVEWERRRSGEGCVICLSGGPLDVIASFESCWATAAREAPLPGYVCVVAREHVVEPFEMREPERALFWNEAMVIASAVAEAVQPIKMNYEIHGNTLPHLHLHLFPRQIDDPYVGGPIDPRKALFRRSDDELQALKVAIATARASLGFPATA